MIQNFRLADKRHILIPYSYGMPLSSYNPYYLSSRTPIPLYNILQQIRTCLVNLPVNLSALNINIIKQIKNRTKIQANSSP